MFSYSANKCTHMHLSRGWCVNSTSALLECLYLGCIGWSSAGILLKLCLCSSSCSLVCLIFQLIVRKWMFLKTQLQIFAETNAEVWLCFFFPLLKSCMWLYYNRQSFTPVGKTDIGVLVLNANCKSCHSYGLLFYLLLLIISFKFA